MLHSILPQQGDPMRGYECREICPRFFQVTRPDRTRCYGVDLRGERPHCSCPWFSSPRNPLRCLHCKHVGLVAVVVNRRDQTRRRRAVRIAAWFRAAAAPAKPKRTVIPYVNGIYWHPLTDPATDGRVRTAEAQARAERVYRNIRRDFPL